MHRSLLTSRNEVWYSSKLSKLSKISPKVDKTVGPFFTGGQKWWHTGGQKGWHTGGKKWWRRGVKKGEPSPAPGGDKPSTRRYFQALRMLRHTMTIILVRLCILIPIRTCTYCDFLWEKVLDKLYSF